MSMNANDTRYGDLVGVRVESIEWKLDRFLMIFENGASIEIRPRFDYDVLPPRVSPEGKNKNG